MHYCTSNTPDDSPQSYVMNIQGAGSNSCFHHQPSKPYESFDYNVDNAPINNYVVEGSILHSKSHGKSTMAASLPYPVSPPNPCKQTIDPGRDTVHRSPELNQMPWPAVPSFLSDFNFPGLDFVSGAPGPSWSSFGPDDDYMRQYLSASREGKRPSGRLMEPRTRRIELKKSRLNPEASCPPLKVRKEKLGGRIAALQQLVAPYGKTDTASVLSEAIGYIKFLQDQVEALSLPYTAKLSRVWADQKSRGGLGEESSGSKGELRKQGLCLVPLTCASHIDFANCGGPLFNWPFPRVG